MNLQTTIELYSGGPGSGCHGDNCGRPSTSIGDKPLYARKLREAGLTDQVLRKVPVKVIRVKRISPDDATDPVSGAEGYYDIEKGEIVLSSFAGYRTAMHEIGHHLDYTIFDGRFSDEMNDHYTKVKEEGSPRFLSNLPLYALSNIREFVAESFAEYVHRGPDFKKHYPEVSKTYDQVIKRLNTNTGVYSKRDLKRNKNNV